MSKVAKFCYIHHISTVCTSDVLRYTYHEIVKVPTLRSMLLLPLILFSFLRGRGSAVPSRKGAQSTVECLTGRLRPPPAAVHRHPLSTRVS